MARKEHLAVLSSGVEAWNSWRDENMGRVADLSGTQLGEANLCRADFHWADLSGVSLIRANLIEARFTGAQLGHALLMGANLSRANLSGADLSGADLTGADLTGAFMDGAQLGKASLIGADLSRADLSRVNFREAFLAGARLSRANLTEADLSNADLSGATLLGARLVKADLTGCRVYGLSAWDVDLTGTKQQRLVITPLGQSEITVDDLEVAQFVYLLLHNKKIGAAINAICQKGVLLLGRFTEGRLALLERLCEELRSRNFLPIVFNFDKPDATTFTETVRILAGLSRFVIVDMTNPRSAPLELQATVPEMMIPFVPILQAGERPFSMFQDLWIEHRDRVLDPISYASVDDLVCGLDIAVVEPALIRAAELMKRKAEQLRVRSIEEILRESRGE